MFSTIRPLRMRGMHDDHRDGNVEIRAWCGMFGISNLKSLGFGPQAIRFATIRKLNLEGERLAVTADSQGDYPARRCFADHPAQLCALSTSVPFMVRMTSCSLMPALPAGAS